MNDTAQKTYKNLRDVLVDRGLIDQAKADEIGLIQLKTGESEEAIIRAQRLVSEEKFVQSKAIFLRVPYVDLDTIGFSPEALTLVPESVSRKYKIVPYKLDTKNKLLYVAMANPLDLETVEFIEKKSGVRVSSSMALEKQIMSYVNEKYEREKGITLEVGKALDERKKDEKEEHGVESGSGKVSVEAPVAKIVSTILEYAVKARASDIHIEPQEENVRIRYRIDGILQEKYVLPRNVQDAVVSRIKILSSLKIDEKRVPQDGRFFFSADGNDVDCGYQLYPQLMVRRWLCGF